MYQYIDILSCNAEKTHLIRPSQADLAVVSWGWKHLHINYAYIVKCLLTIIALKGTYLYMPLLCDQLDPPVGWHQHSVQVHQ